LGERTLAELADGDRDTSHAGASADTVPPAEKVAYDLPETFGRYRIIEKLGEGGMGSVYLAHDTQLDRPVALKVPQFSPQDDPQVRQRFLREAQAAANIRHPNLCPVYDAGEIGGVPYLTMAYLDGSLLSEYVRPEQPPPEKPTAELVRKLAWALQEAHAHGIVHRDLKPANIFVDRCGEPVVMDFGLARRTTGEDVAITQHGALLGTPAYMAPEQARGKGETIGPACDIYGLGVILYELLTGRRPFRGQLLEVLSQILTEEPEPPSQHRPDLDRSLQAICLKALAKRPEDRYASMAEFAAALTGYLAGEASQQGSSPVPGDLAVAEPGGAGRGECRPQPAAPAAIHPRSRRYLAAAVLVGSALPVLYFGVTWFVATTSGTLEIQTFGDDVKVIVARDGETVTIIDTKTNHRVKLSAGRYELALAESAAGIRLSTDRFELRRGEERIVTVRFEPASPLNPQQEMRQLPETLDRPKLLERVAFDGQDGQLPHGWRAVLGTWEARDGVLQANMAIDYRLGFVFGPQRSWQDYAVECDVQLQQGLAGVVFRRNREGTSYGFAMIREIDVPEDDQDVVIEFSKHRYQEDARWPGEENYSMATLAKGACTLTRGTTHRIRVEVVGRSMRALVDHECVLEASDPELPSTEGGIGFVMRNTRWKPGIAFFGELDVFQLGADYFRGQDDPGAEPAGDAWTLEAPMPVPRVSHTASTVGDKIYVIGGDNTWRRVDMFDPAHMRWIPRQDAPEDFRDHAAAVIDGKIFLVGGEERGICSFKSSCWEYDPSVDVWTRRADRPLATASLAAVSLDGQLIAVGGYPAGGPLPGSDAVHRFDPVSDTWTTLRSLPVPTASCRAAVVAGQVYLFAGVHHERSFVDTFLYDPLANAWEPGVAQPRGRWVKGGNNSVVTAAGQIVMAGGDTKQGVLSEVDVFDCTQQQWRLGAPLPSPRAAHAVAVCGDKIYVFGGRNPSGPSASVYSLDCRELLPP
jgi:N-acetylneuraminic acid mutarotase/predicted Ser/Thr protein kinase